MLAGSIAASKLVGTDIATVGTITAGTWHATKIGLAYGGTNLDSSAAANGALLIGNGSGFTLSTLTGTSNQVTVTNSAGGITLSLPQSIATTSTPQFGLLGIGTAANSAIGLNVAPTLSVSGTARGLFFNPTFGSAVTNAIAVNGSGSVATGGTATNAYSYQTADWTLNGTGAITNLYGFAVNGLTVGANNFAFRGNVVSGSNRWNLYMDGTAANYLSGNLLIGTTTIPSGAVTNLVLSGGATALGGATTDCVNLAAIDKAAGDRRLYIQSESGNTISIGNDTLNFAASTGNFSIGGTTVLALTSSAATLSDAVNISIGSTTGTKIGTSTSQKLGFWNATPVTQYSTTGTTTGFTAGTGTTVVSGSTFTGNTGSSAYTIGDVVAALKKCGIMAS